jgi:hypothetical protein
MDGARCDELCSELAADPRVENCVHVIRIDLPNPERGSRVKNRASIRSLPLNAEPCKAPNHGWRHRFADQHKEMGIRARSGAPLRPCDG